MRRIKPWPLWPLLIALAACSGPGTENRSTRGVEQGPVATATTAGVPAPTQHTQTSGEAGPGHAGTPTVAPLTSAMPDAAATATIAARQDLIRRYAAYEIVTLLPQDAIPAIDDPEFVSAEEAEESYEPDELVMGVVFGGEARAYSVPLLSRHEIVNDTVAGVKIAVTW